MGFVGGEDSETGERDIEVIQEPLKLPGWMTCSKNFKTPFFQDIKMGPEPRQIFFYKNISTNMAARSPASFGTLGGATDTLIK